MAEQALNTARMISTMKKRKQLDAAEEVECLVKSRRSSKKSRWGRIPTRIDDLPDALLVDILVRLPLESVHQCKSVSKRWLSFISDPWFGRQITLPFTLVCEHPNPCHKEEFLATGSHGIAPFFSSVRGVRIVGASNDLLLYCFPKSSSSTESVFYVCNPFTKQHWMKLPALAFKHDYEKRGIGFVCEPRYKVTDDGRYVINSSYNYRVVCTDLNVFNSSPSLELDVFFSETGQWSKTVVTVPPWFHFTHQMQSLGIVCDAKLHWITETNVIFAYDPFADRCTLIDIPAELKGAGNKNPFDNVRLGECRGRLRILRLLSTYDPQLGRAQGLPPVLFTVWELKDYSAGEWCIVHDLLIDPQILQIAGLNYYRISTSFYGMAVVFHPFDVDIVYLWLPGDFIVCNLGSAEFQVKSASKNVIYHTSDMVFSLVEQLFPTPVTTTTSNSIQDTSRSPILTVPDFQQCR